jgi:uncharacterized lipoprotein YajG
MMKVHQQLPEHLMKSVLVLASLSLFSACAFAAEPADALATACVAPVFPPVSTSNVGAQRVEKRIRKWNDCVASQATEENKLRDVVVKAQARKWIAATLQYVGGRHAGVVTSGRYEHERITPRIAFDEREKLEALSSPAIFARSEK